MDILRFYINIKIGNGVPRGYHLYKLVKHLVSGVTGKIFERSAKKISVAQRQEHARILCI